MSARDKANGYEVMAEAFMSTRSRIGETLVRRWARLLPCGGSVLDLGCGHGVPISQALIEEGLSIHGIDASPSLIAAFRLRFPNAVSECRATEESDFFHRTFDGVVAWGLMFLLAPDIQALVVRKVSRALIPGGRFLFTAPTQACEWLDVLTGLKSVSLGAEQYCRLLAVEGFMGIAHDHDEGGNHYYLAEKVAEP